MKWVRRTRVRALAESGDTMGEDGLLWSAAEVAALRAEVEALRVEREALRDQVAYQRGCLDVLEAHAGLRKQDQHGTR